MSSSRQYIRHCPPLADLYLEPPEDWRELVTGAHYDLASMADQCQFETARTCRVVWRPTPEDRQEVAIHDGDTDSQQARFCGLGVRRTH